MYIRSILIHTYTQYLSLTYSGTYNNQYMVLDLNRVHINRSIDDGALWVVEQIPGYALYWSYVAENLWL